jgi:hypothetical protein
MANFVSHLALKKCQNVFRIERNSVRNVNFVYADFGLEFFQDFLFTLDMKQRLHLVEISIFSINNFTVRLTKIMNNLNGIFPKKIL